MNKQEKRSYDIFKKWAKCQGLQITKDYTLKKREARGYDFEARNEKGEITTYEVKGSRYENAIPDMRDSEFENGKLRANFLFVVGNIFQRGKEVRYIIPRNAIKPENLSPRTYYFISRFQNKKVMGEFIEPKGKKAKQNEERDKKRETS